MTAQSDRKSSSSPQVIAFPARTPLVDGRQIYFMFSVRQVVDVLRQVDLQPAPDRKLIVGLTDWRGTTVPVVDLENRLGLRILENGMSLRNIVVRSVIQDPLNGDRDLYAVCPVGAAVRQFQLPLPCKTVTPSQRFAGVDLIEGMYVMAEYLFIVANLNKIVNGTRKYRPEEAVYVL